jgi:hypothetical protein
MFASLAHSESDLDEIVTAAREVFAAVAGSRSD